MRGLPFPQDAAFNREQSHEFGTPGPASTSGLGDNIPLDPAFAGHPAAPLFIPNGAGPSGSHQDISPLSPSLAIQRYAQGPQGDPFAPQLQLYGYPIPNAVPNSNPTPKPAKRKRKPRREEDCGFCSGNDSRNKHNQKELMVTCDECGRSGHPSCMQLGDIGEVLRSYPWKCTECKNCEICHEKGDDERILFCDNCDRGWHMDCLNPPVNEAPEGRWTCPLCPDIHEPISEHTPSPEIELQPEADPPIDPALQMDIDPMLREASVASSSHHPLPPSPPPPLKSRSSARGKRDRKGKARALMSEDEDGAVQRADVDADAEYAATFAEEENDEAMLRTPTSSRRRSSIHRKKGKGRPRRRSESVPDDGESPGPPLRPQKRIRLIQNSPPRKKTIRLRLSNQKGKGKMREDDEEEETRKGLFDDILSVDDRDTSKTSMLGGDKEKFERARQLAESKLASQSIVNDSRSKSPVPSTISGRFPLRSVVHQLQRIQTQSHIPTSHPDSPSPSTPGPSYKFDPNVLRIRTIRFGPYDIQTWYDAPFPEEFSNIPDGRLWICEFCLKYMKSRFGAQRHRLKCKCRHPPGDEIYRDGSISIFEVDGRRNKIYCQNLCLLSKMFLDHKSLFYDVEPFLFYVMTEVDDFGARFVGYFSKEKRSPKDLNLSCIMTLPVRQRQGWGNLLIDFSYLLSKKEQKSGTPERPLSALGEIGYKKYWILALMRYLQNAPCNPRLEDISTATAMSIEDIYNTLASLNMITVHENRSSPVRPSPGRSVKFNRSRKVGIARRNLQKAQPKDDDKSKTVFVPPPDYDVHWDNDVVDNFLVDWDSKGYLTLKPDRLKWTPFLISRSEKQAAFQPFVEDGAVIVAEAETSLASGAAAVIAHEESLIDVDVFADSAQPMDSPLPDADAPSEGKVAEPSRDVKVFELSSPKQASVEPEHLEQEHHDAEHEASPSPSLSPTPLPPPPPPPPKLPPPPRSSTNGLEALAAVALAVSKANPGGLRRKSSSTTASPSTERISKFDPILTNGDLEAFVNPQPIVNSVKLSVSTQSPVIQEMSANKVLTENEDPRMKIETPTPSLDLTTNGRSRIVNGFYPVSSNRTPSVSPQESGHPNGVDDTNVIEQDAELAARLAREETGQRRSLRSHPTPPLATVNTKDINAKDSLRKRRKAVLSPISDTSPLTPMTPDRPTTRSRAHAQAMESARSNRLTRSQATRLSTNGTSLPNGDSQTPSNVRTSARLNGNSPSKSTHLVSTPVRPQRGRLSSRNEDRHEAANLKRLRTPPAALEGTQGEGDVDAEGESDVDADGEPDIPSGDDTKYTATNGGLETMGGRRLNGFNSSDQSEGTETRKSLTSSIRTVHPGSPTLSSLSPSATTSINGSPTSHHTHNSPFQSEEAGLVPNGVETSRMDVEDEDLDAEGEPDDEDAEGELDTEMYQ